MKTFKIRDLMIALRPGIGTPQRPKPFDCCLPSCVDISDDCGADSIQPFLDTGGCDCTDDVTCDCTDIGSICDCTDEGTCDCSDACTGGCTATCNCSDACTLTCGPTCVGCSEACTLTCRGTCTLHCTAGCTLACSKACTRAVTVCEIAASICRLTCANASCAVSLRQPQIEQMAPAQLARLKAQLRAAAGKVRKRESALAAAAESKALVPKTIEQVDSLEKLLSEALEALRARRAELQKAEPKGGQPNRKGK